MRTALHNGYNTLSSLCFALNTPCPSDTLELLTERSPLFVHFLSEFPNISFDKFVYSTHPCADSYWGIDDVSLTRQQFTRIFRYCPKCLLEELITIFSDVKNIEHCPIHMIKCITQCPQCQKKESWTNANLLYCACGYERRTAPCETAIFVDKSRVHVFGTDSYIKELSSLTKMAIICETLWIARQPDHTPPTHKLFPTILKHAKSMISYQSSEHPNFTKPMHLAPWVKSHAVLRSYADNALAEELSINPRRQCTNDSCCSQVEFSLKELHYLIGGNSKWLWKNDFIQRNFEYDKNKSPYSRHYKSCTPLCQIVDQITSHISQFNKDKKLIELKHYRIREACTLLKCTTDAAAKLIKSGILVAIKSEQNPGPKNLILITKKSVNAFRKLYILTSEIAFFLGSSTHKTRRLIQELEITHVSDISLIDFYHRNEIFVKLEELRKALLYRKPLLPASSSTDELYNITPAEAANKLGIAVTLFHRRFLLTNLIMPKIFDGKKFLSASQIHEAKTHLINHLSIQQIGDIIGYHRGKVRLLIERHQLKPSCTLTLCNGDTQHLYDPTSIYELRNLLQSAPYRPKLTRKRCGSTTTRRSSDI